MWACNFLKDISAKYYRRLKKNGKMIWLEYSFDGASTDNYHSDTYILDSIQAGYLGLTKSAPDFDFWPKYYRCTEESFFMRTKPGGPLRLVEIVDRLLQCDDTDYSEKIFFRDNFYSLPLSKSQCEEMNKLLFNGNAIRNILKNVGI